MNLRNERHLELLSITRLGKRGVKIETKPHSVLLNMSYVLSVVHHRKEEIENADPGRWKSVETIEIQMTYGSPYRLMLDGEYAVHPALVLFDAFAGKEEEEEKKTSPDWKNDLKYH